MAVPRTLSILLLLLVVGSCVADATKTRPRSPRRQHDRDNHHRDHHDRDHHDHRDDHGHDREYEHKPKPKSKPLPKHRPRPQPEIGKPEPEHKWEPRSPQPKPKPITWGYDSPRLDDKCSVSGLDISDVAELLLREIRVVLSVDLELHCIDLLYAKVDVDILAPLETIKDLPLESTGHCFDLVYVRDDGSVEPVDKSHTLETWEVNDGGLVSVAVALDLLARADKVVRIDGRVRVGDGILVCLEVTLNRSGKRSWGKCEPKSPKGYEVRTWSTSPSTWVRAR